MPKLVEGLLVRPQPGMEQGCGTHEWDKKVLSMEKNSDPADVPSLKVLYISYFEDKAIIFNMLPFVPVIEVLF